MSILVTSFGRVGLTHFSILKAFENLSEYNLALISN
jgi:hypothetical protein